MHESGLAKNILTTVLDRATSTNAKRVRLVRGWVAETEALKPDSLAFHFAAHARGTVADGARLSMKIVHVKARCRACGAEYLPEHHIMLCPECASTEGDLLGQTGVGIESIDVE